VSDDLGWGEGLPPSLHPETAFFWQAGATGRLQILRCQRCGLYLHPPAPICRACRAPDVAPEDVSGRGELFSYTVNRHEWRPDQRRLYVVGLVELDEQPGLRLTTNIVRCGLESLNIGMRVKVFFEPVGEVWLPLFEPDQD